MGAFLKDTLKHKHIRVISLTLSLVVIGLIMVWVRALYGSMRAYHQGETHMKAHQYIKAITFFDRSMRWYAPLNPYVGQSAERLWEIGLQAEQRGDIPLALIAMRTIRRGFYATRSFYRPGANWIKQCDAKITKLMRLEQTQQERQVAQRRLEKSVPASKKAQAPHILWSMVVEVSFLGWIGSVIGLIMFSCKGGKKVRILTSPALAWGTLALVFFTLWLVGMMKA